VDAVLTGKKNRVFKRSVADTRGSRLMGFAELRKFRPLPRVGYVKGRLTTGSIVKCVLLKST